MSDKKGCSACSLNHKGVKNANASERSRPISGRCMYGTDYAGLGESKFTIGCMICLYYLLFSVMVDQGYFIIWSLFEFKAFHVLFC